MVAELVAFGIDPQWLLRSKNQLEVSMIEHLLPKVAEYRRIMDQNLAVMIADEVVKRFK